MTSEQKIKDYIKNGNLRSIVSYVKREHSDIYKKVIELSGNTFTEKLYKYLNNETGVCSVGNKKKFISISDGYRFCGRASICQCCKNSVSMSVSENKKSRTPDEIEKENKKRCQTNIDKYGVENTGKLDIAIQHHKEFYSDEKRVREVVQKVANSVQRNGTTFKKSEEQKSQMRELKRKQELESNPSISILYCKETLSGLLANNTVDDICRMASCHRTTVLKNMLYHGLREKRESSLESDMYNWLTSIGGFTIHRNTRSILPSGRELDFYIPEHNMAIEMCGEYFHCDQVREDRMYHIDKFKECEELGIHLFTIFSNVWHNKNDIIKRMLSHKLHVSGTSVYARKCKVIEVDSKAARKFCDSNHLKGYVNSSVKLGLEYNGELVALMTLGKTRRTIGKEHGDGAFEIYRFVTSRNVVGGASKLLSHFEKEYSPTIICSFSDNEYSLGNLYSKIGMVLESESVGYFYYKGGLSFSRNNFQKHKLVQQGHDPKKSEKQIMDELGYYRVWDCGTKTWIKKY